MNISIHAQTFFFWRVAMTVRWMVRCFVRVCVLGWDKAVWCRHEAALLRWVRFSPPSCSSDFLKGICWKSLQRAGLAANYSSMHVLTSLSSQVLSVVSCVFIPPSSRGWLSLSPGGEWSRWLCFGSRFLVAQTSLSMVLNLW